MKSSRFNQLVRRVCGCLENAARQSIKAVQEALAQARSSHRSSDVRTAWTQQSSTEAGTVSRRPFAVSNFLDGKVLFSIVFLSVVFFTAQAQSETRRFVQVIEPGFNSLPIGENSVPITRFGPHDEPEAACLFGATPVIRSAGNGDFQCFNQNGSPQKASGENVYAMLICEKGGSKFRGQCPRTCGPEVGNPVNVESGEKIERTDDWVSPKDSRFRLSRYYLNSPVAFDLGGPWRTNLSNHIIAIGNGASVSRFSGLAYEFTDVNGTWVAKRQDTIIVLTGTTTSGWTVEDGSGKIESYDPNGWLVGITWPDAYTITISRDPQGLPVTMIDNRDQRMSFTASTITVPNITAIGEVLVEHQKSNATAPRTEITYAYQSKTSAYGNDVLLLESASIIELIHDGGSGSFVSSDSEVLAEYTYWDDGFNDRLKTIKDGEGVIYGDYAYDPSSGRVTLSNHPEDADKVTISYNDSASPREVIVTNASDVLQTTYKFQKVQGRDRVVEVLGQEILPHCLGTSKSVGYTPSPAGAPEGFVYERTHERLDGGGAAYNVVTQYERNSRGLVTQKTEDVGGINRVTTREWHPTLRLPTKITTTQMEETLVYDANGQLELYTQKDVLPSSPTNGQERTWDFIYQPLASGLKVLDKIDGPGLVSDGVTDIVDYYYDANGVLTKITNEVGHVTDILSVNERGQPTLVLAPTGVQTSFEYDFRGRLTKVIRDVSGPISYETSFVYDDLGQITEMTLPKGGVWKYTYDDARRLDTVENPLGETIAYQQDEFGNIEKTEYKKSNGVVRFFFDQEFDELGRIAKYLGASNQTWEYSHDKEDNLEATTDPFGNIVSTPFDDLNRLMSITDENGTGANDQAITMAYNDTDLMTDYTDQRSLTTTMEYNGFGEVVKEISPDKGTTEYEYDTRGLMIAMTDARGSTYRANYSYDDLGRIVEIDYPSFPSNRRQFQYDQGAIENTGYLTKIIDFQPELHNQSFTYNRQGLMKTDVRWIDGRKYSARYVYDDDDLMIRQDYPSNRQVLYDRDASGQITRVRTRPLIGGTYGAWSDVVTGVQHEPFGPLRFMQYENTLSHFSTFDQSYRLRQQRDYTLANVNVRRWSYQYEASGGKERDNLRRASDVQNSANRQDFTYNSRQLLTGATGPWGSISYDYDSVGNRVSFQDGSVTEDYVYPPTTPLSSEPPSNRLGLVVDGATTLRNFTYDAAGRTIEEIRTQGVAGVDWDYAYNAPGRLTSVSKDDILQASYVYNYFGQQVLRTVWTGGVATKITSIHDQDGRRIAEYDSGTGNLLREYIWLDDRPIAVIEGGQTFFVHVDHIDRPVLVTDSSGTEVWAATYTPFGDIHTVDINTGALSAQDLRFPGQWFQAETELHQNWHRDYDPTLGRYLQPDPLGLIDGPSVYGYARQNSMRFVDPDGQNSFSPPVTKVPEMPAFVSTLLRGCGLVVKRAVQGVALTLSMALTPTEACGCGPVPCPTPEEARRHAKARGAALVAAQKESGVGTGAGRSGGHGTPFIRAGSQLVREGNQQLCVVMKDAFKKEGNRLINRGRSINHRGGRR